MAPTKRLTDVELDLLIRKAGISDDPAAEGKMQIEVARIRALQFGYEQRIARQVQSIDRLLLQVEQLERSNLEHKQRANEAARLAADAADALPVSKMVADMDVVGGIAAERDAEQAKIVMLGHTVGQRFPWQGMPTGDIQRVWHVIDHLDGEIERLGKWIIENEPQAITGQGAVDTAIGLMGRTKVMSGTEERLSIMAAELKALIPDDWDLYNEDDTEETIVVGYVKWCMREARDQRAKQRALVKVLRETEAERDRLASELRNMVGIVKATTNLVEGDDTPPWMAKSTVSRNTPLTDVDPGTTPGEAETLPFDLSGQHPGEQRPGGF